MTDYADGVPRAECEAAVKAYDTQMASLLGGVWHPEFYEQWRLHAMAKAIMAAEAEHIRAADEAYWSRERNIDEQD